MFEKVIELSGHGTDTGIWPRFFLQMHDLGQFAVGKQEFDTRSEKYFKDVIPQIEKFYDIFHDYKNLVADYREGIKSGKFYKIDERGHITHTKMPETKIFDKVKDFFIHGKIMLVTFVESGIIDEPGFNFTDFYFAGENKLEQKKIEYLKTTEGYFIPLITLLEKAQNSLLRPFNSVRGDIEHNRFNIDDFKLEESMNGAIVNEPLFQNKSLSVTLQVYYDKILDLIEKLVAYYFGIKAETKPGCFELYVRREYNYPKLLYKFTIAFGGNVLLGTPADKCGYN